MQVNHVTAFLLALIPLVVFHELGHFVMAKIGGIHVYKFCIGFGKKLFGFTYRGTEYCWNLLPLGGYVDFMGELVYTGDIPKDVTHFYNRPKLIRFLVLVMGPMFNLILAFVIFWGIHTVTPAKEYIYIGEPYTVGVLAENTPEGAAGLMPGDRILNYNGEPITDWNQMDLLVQFSPDKEVVMQVERGGEKLNITYTVPAHKQGYGIQGFYPDMRIQVRRTVKDSPAAKAGLLAGDLVLAVNDIPITYYTSKQIGEQLAANSLGAASFKVLRAGEQLDLVITPYEKEDPETKEKRWVIGMEYEHEHTSRKLNVLEALPFAWATFLDQSTTLFKAVKSLVTGDLPMSMLSGPVGIAQVAKDAMAMGMLTFFSLLAFLSLNLGIMNLLPIPVLDGGEIFVLLVEGITGQNFSLDTKIRIKMVGLFFLVLLMAFVFISDIFKLF